MLFDLNQIPTDTKTAEVLHWERIKKIKTNEVPSGWTDRIIRFGWKMVKTCLVEDGIGLAAPQVGLFRKAMVCRELDDDGWDYKFKDQFRLYLNPNFQPILEDGKWNMVEYCLSVPGKGYEIERWRRILVTWDEPWPESETGEFVRKERILEGWAARLFQHEFDHLNGISIPQRHSLQNKPKKTKRKKRKKR